MKVLHDYDAPFLNKRYALKRGIQLILYVLSRYIKILRKIEFINKVYEENRKHLNTMIRLDMLVGVEPIVGINHDILKYYPEIFEEMRGNYGVDIREHIHIGNDNDPNRKRIWIPHLDQSKKSWRFDTDFVNGKGVLLDENDLPIWHIDYPYYLSYYIEYLYKKFKLEDAIKSV